MDHEEIWLVQLSNGAVRAMTLDELDAAYQEGAIDEETYVRRDGASTWSKLRDEIGGAEPAPAPAPAPAVVPVAYAAPAPAAMPVASYGAVPAYTPPVQPAFYSTRPVVSEVDLDELELGSPFKKSRKGTYAAIGAVAVAAIATAVFGATRMSGTPDDAVNASVAAAAQPPPQVVTPPPATPDPASTLSDAQRKELSAMDKKNQSSWEQRRKARDHAAPHYRYHRSGSPFHRGGNKYDPLNAKL